MRTKCHRTVALADLQTNLFVRKVLDQDHVLFLADLIAGGVEMRDPIEVTDLGCENNVVDGRHRKEAYELADVTKEIKVKVLEFEDEAEMIAYAYKANTGGSKPPTPADTEHAIMLLIDRGESRKRIAEMLGLQTSMARKYVDEVQSRMVRAKLQRAAAAVTEGGLTVAKAAEQYEVGPEKLKEVLSGHRRKHKHGIAEIHQVLTKSYKSMSLKNVAQMRSLLEKYEDGDVTERQVREIFEHIEQLQKRAAKSLAEMKKRFNGMNESSAAAAAKENGAAASV